MQNYTPQAFAEELLRSENLRNFIQASVREAIQDTIQASIQEANAPLHKEIAMLKNQYSSLVKSGKPQAPQTNTRQQIPHPETFDGTNRTRFLPWKTAMEAKLSLEGTIIGDARAQFFYIHSRLGDKALEMVTAYIAQKTFEGHYDPENLLEYLTKIYDDPNKKGKAVNQLHALKQGKNASFARFLPIFEKLLAEAGGLRWDDENRINALEQAIHPDLKKAYAAAIMPTDYDGYVSHVLGTAARIEAADGPSRSRNRHTPAAAIDPNSMDWEPSVNSTVIQEENKALKGKRARWVSKEELARRKAEKRCLCCSRKGCSIKKCPLLPAVRPAQAVNIAAVAIEEGN